MNSITLTTATNAAVRDARDFPELVGNLEQVNPTLAAQLTGKALIASRTPWGVVVSAAIAWVAGRYAFGWSAEFDSAIAGVVVLLASYAMRAITRQPITSLVSAPVVVPPAVTPIPVTVK